MKNILLTISEPANLKRFFAVMVASIMLFVNVGTAFAVEAPSGLPEEEQNALNNWANWVADVCAPDTPEEEEANYDDSALADFVRAVAFTENGGKVTEDTLGSQGGKYGMLNTWYVSEAEKYYPPAKKYGNANATPEALQDAKAYIKFSVLKKRFNGDYKKMAMYHMLPASVDSTEAAERVYNGNGGNNALDYGDLVVKRMKAKVGKNIPLKYEEAPDFEKWYKEKVGEKYDIEEPGSATNSPTSSTDNGPIVNSSKTKKNGQSLGGVGGTGFTKAEVEKAKKRGRGEFKGASDFYVTTYGPPWDRTEGTGVTSTGLDLEGPNNNHGKPRYVIAVDPNVIPYGSLVTVWPNAVNWKGPFLAADTGGAIDGHHVDVYDWSGDGKKDVFSARNAKIEPWDGVIPEDSGNGADQSSDTQVCCPADGVNASPGTGAPDGMTFPNLDPNAMANAINKWIASKNPRSTMKNLGATIVATAKHNDINPFLLPTIALKESSLGDPGVFNVSQGNNAFGRTAAPGQPSFQGSRAWYKWSSIKASVDYTAPENKAQPGSGGDMGGYIKDVYPDMIKKNDFAAFFNKYAPPSDNNNTSLYIAQVKGWVKELVDLTNGTTTAPNGTGVNVEVASPGAATCCPPQGSEVTSPADLNGKPDFIDMSGPPVNGTDMGHGKMSKIDTLVIHYVQGDGEGARLKSFFMGTPEKLGVQFNIGKTGKIYQYFPLNNMQVAYHTGNINSQAIGIEITGKDGEELMNNSKQFNAVVQTVKYLCDRYDIPCSQPKGDITGSSVGETQGLIGHDEAPTNDHSDPDTKYVGRSQINIATGKPWTDADRKDSSKHAYMMKLRTALGYNQTPGSAKKGSQSMPDATTGNSCPAPPSNATAGEMKKTITVKEPRKFITMPSKYSCPGRQTKIDARIAASLAYIIEKYNLCAHDGLASGHKSHGAGLGVDLVPRSNPGSKESWKNTAEAAARDMGWFGDGASDPKGSKKGCANYTPGDYGQCMGAVYKDKIPKWVRWIGYNGDVDHGDPWHIYGGSYAHIHLGWDTPNGDGVAPGIVSEPRESVYTFPAPVPADIERLIN